MTIRNLFFFILFSLASAGCRQLGSSHLPPDKMEHIIYDISIAEAYSTKTKDNANFGGIKNMDSLAVYYADILAHYGVTKDEFEESLAWYKNHPDDIDSIYTHLSVKADKINMEESRKKRQLNAPANSLPAKSDTAHASAADTIKPGQARVRHQFTSQ